MTRFSTIAAYAKTRTSLDLDSRRGENERPSLDDDEAESQVQTGQSNHISLFETSSFI